MKKILVFVLLPLALILISPTHALAQTMMGSTSDNHTAREEQVGKEIWEKLQAKQLECKNLTVENYGSLGEYFMGQMMGSSHETMNTMMENMMGKESEEQMHVVMGKRLSGCDTNAQFPQGGIGFMPMMGMISPWRSFTGMGGGGNPMMGSGWGNMMGGWGGFGVLGWLSMLLFWILLILGVIALFRYLGGSGKRGDEGKSPLDILKERYARGEIGKKEFEEMKKDLD